MAIRRGVNELQPDTRFAVGELNQVQQPQLCPSHCRPFAPDPHQVYPFANL